MAKNCYIGVSNKARKVKKIYVGVSNKARKVKKGYIGVGGKARCFFSSGGLEYYGKATDLRTKRTLTAETAGNYAIFSSGNNNVQDLTVDAYNTSLTRSNVTNASNGDYYMCASSVGSYALFAGGGDRIVDAYNSSLTKYSGKIYAVSSTRMASSKVGNYALFGGGENYTDSVAAFNSSLTMTNPTSLSTNGRRYMAGAHIGNYAIFGGGDNGYNYADTNAYNVSLTKSTPTALSVARKIMATATVGNYALFGGGTTAISNIDLTGSSSAVVDAYNISLTRSNPTGLSVARSRLAATSVGNYALFGGGYGASSVVDYYDTSLTRRTTNALSSAKYQLAATSVGNYALFGGGIESSTSRSSAVDAYVVS